MRDFRAFAPATIDTFAAHWRQKVYHRLIEAVRHVRYEDAPRANWYLGQADAGVHVLYDCNDPLAYQTLRSYERVARVMRARFSEP